MENGKPFETAEPTAVGSIVMVIVHGLCWAGLVVAPLYFVVPRFIRLFDDFGLIVPKFARWVFLASHWAHALWYVVPFLFLGLLAVDGAVHFQLGQDPATRRARRVWSTLGIIVPLGLFLASFVAIVLPMIDLTHGLAK